MSDPRSYSELESKSINSVKWQGITEVAIRLLQFLTTIFLARILMPEDFGLINIAFIFTQLAYVLFDFGFSTALIQKKEISDRHYKSVFSIFLFSSLVFFGLINGLSEFIAGWFQIPRVSGVLEAIIFIVFAYALHAIPQIILMREMRFKELSRLQLVAALIYSITAITLALNDYGVFSFVYAVLCEQYVLAGLLIIRTGWRPKVGWNKKAVMEIAGFGSKVMGTRIVGYINTNLPNIIIGKFLGAHWLGLYSIAFQLADFPVQRIAKMVLKVMFPAFSQLQDQLEEFRKLYRKVLHHLELVLFPVFAGMIIIAEPFFHVVYGDKWNEAIIPFQIMIGLGALRSLWTINSLVFLSIGRPQIELKINSGMVLCLLPALIIATNYGLIMCCVVLVVVVACFWLIGMAKSIRLIQMPLVNYLEAGLIPVSGCLAMLGLSVFLKTLVVGNVADLLQLIVLISVNILIYSGVIYAMDRKVFKKIPHFLGS